ncbi:hypothetical protein WM11_12030 [Burkholderia ubonensis]|uniref:hypothetical protein n=1 Tax=Burkholderia ubonensis TaxID=101571 RepID=UPI00075DD802|nr:hypothetical protein [Burkholderia ubonensis]KWK06109.1 hypothetical protein WM11_12030 [Burkholderia ubonensis]KWK56604.1 hypothetical protein WM14_27525 [Burkholderia ubonensis]
MANTRGFEIVAELTPAALLNMLQAAWANPTVFPKNVDIPSGAFGGFMVQGGQVQLPLADLDVQPSPPSALRFGFGLDIQIQLQDPPVPSAALIAFSAEASVEVPLGSVPGQEDVALLFGALGPADPASVTLPGGNPVTANLPSYIGDFVHEMYEDDGAAFPHHFSQTHQSMLVYTFDADLDLYDDPANPAHRIQAALVTVGGAEQLEVVIPIHLRISNLTRTLSFAPDLHAFMGIEAQLVLTSTDLQLTGPVSVNLSNANVTVRNLVPAGPDYGDEGPNYIANRTIVAPYGDLDTLLATNLANQAQTQFVATLAPFSFAFPSTLDIQAFIATALRDNLVARPPFEVWPGKAAPPVALKDVAVRALPDALAIAINASPGADIGLLDNFVPAGRLFAIAISAARTLAMIQQAINDKFPALPVVLNVDGHDVRLKSINPSLTNFLHFSGDVTVINAILGSIDVDAGYDVDVGLEWLPPDAAGAQKLKPDVHDPDIHLSTLMWLLGLLLGFLSGGVIGLVIGIVVLEIIKHVASTIGGTLVTDKVSGAVDGLQAWPSPLGTVGDVQSAFENPIAISPDGLLIGG